MESPLFSSAVILPECAKKRKLTNVSLHVHPAVFLLWLPLTFPDTSIALSHTSPVPCRHDRRIFRSREILQGLSYCTTRRPSPLVLWRRGSLSDGRALLCNAQTSKPAQNVLWCLWLLNLPATRTRMKSLVIIVCALSLWQVVGTFL